MVINRLGTDERKIFELFLVRSVQSLYITRQVIGGRNGQVRFHAFNTAILSL